MDARERMNLLGSRGIPFIFIIDFDMARPVVQPLAEIDPKEILYDINGLTNAPRAGSIIVDERLASLSSTMIEPARGALVRPLIS